MDVKETRKAECIPVILEAGSPEWLSEGSGRA